MGEHLKQWIFFQLDAKLKFAIKVSLSLTLTYMIPMAMGWSQATTAAITVMLIASAGGVSDGISKGIIRIIGTILGAILGLLLIALFPQERLLYLVSLSLTLSLLTYFYYAYQGDSTVFMLGAMTMMMMFINGAENAFLYGMDRTYMTLFGILIYTIVGSFLWPVRAQEDTINDAPKGRVIVWFEPEYFKATIQLFFVFWVSVAFWIYFNPPAGFLVVTLATVLGLLTTFSPLKPGLLIVLFTISFLFASFMYVFVLPNLVYAWELALFIFTYTFIGFYFINQKITIFFLIGLFTLGISNEMNYNFALFLTILLSFYMFLIILMFFYNFPFSARPEYLFSLMKERFIKHSTALIKLENLQDNFSAFEKLQHIYHMQHLQTSVLNMKLWGSKIDTKYFNLNASEDIIALSQECEKYLAKENNIQNCYNAMEKIDWNNLKVKKF